MPHKTMLSLDEVKRLMRREPVSDDEAAAMRDACSELAALVFEAWKRDLKKAQDRERSEDH